MIRALILLARIELFAALHIGAAGEWWAARAARRIGKLSGKYSGGME